MKAGNLKVVRKLHISQNRPAVLIEGPIVKSEEKIIPVPIVVSQGLHLDVDEILRRSLPTWSNHQS